jgi:hypothetical protein
VKFVPGEKSATKRPRDKNYPSGRISLEVLEHKVLWNHYVVKFIKNYLMKVV